MYHCLHSVLLAAALNLGATDFLFKCFNNISDIGGMAFVESNLSDEWDGIYLRKLRHNRTLLIIFQIMIIGRLQLLSVLLMVIVGTLLFHRSRR